ncbi:hypothetical protein Tco_0869699 [Tanacetum coccineum]
MPSLVPDESEESSPACFIISSSTIGADIRSIPHRVSSTGVSLILLGDQSRYPPGKRSARVGANDTITGVDDGTESTEDLHLLQDGPAECEDKCRGLSDESPNDDSDVVGGYKVDSGAAHQRRNASLLHGALLGGAVTRAIGNSDDNDGRDATLLLQRATAITYGS